MRKLVLLMHTSLDGFIGTTSGGLDWIKLNEEIFEYAGRRTREADTALYGRITYQMMEAYWPPAAEKPDATRHDVEHSKWYQSVAKVVVSRTLKSKSPPGTTIISGDLVDQVRKLKHASGKDILLLGSPSVAHALSAAKLIDDYWLMVNPVLLGHGIPLFEGIKSPIPLKLHECKKLKSDVVCLHYTDEHVKK